MHFRSIIASSCIACIAIAGVVRLREAEPDTEELRPRLVSLISSPSPQMYTPVAYQTGSPPEYSSSSSSSPIIYSTSKESRTIPTSSSVPVYYSTSSSSSSAYTPTMYGTTSVPGYKSSSSSAHGPSSTPIVTTITITLTSTEYRTIEESSSQSYSVTLIPPVSSSSLSTPRSYQYSTSIESRTYSPSPSSASTSPTRYLSSSILLSSSKTSSSIPIYPYPSGNSTSASLTTTAYTTTSTPGYYSTIPIPTSTPANYHTTLTEQRSYSSLPPNTTIFFNTSMSATWTIPPYSSSSLPPNTTIFFSTTSSPPPYSSSSTPAAYGSSSCIDTPASTTHITVSVPWPPYEMEICHTYPPTCASTTPALTSVPFTSTPLPSPTSTSSPAYQTSSGSGTMPTGSVISVLPLPGQSSVPMPVHFKTSSPLSVMPTKAATEATSTEGEKAARRRHGRHWWETQKGKGWWGWPWNWGRDSGRRPTRSSSE